MAAQIFVVLDDRYVLALIVGELFNAGYEVVPFDDPMFAVRALNVAERVDVLVTGVEFGPGKMRDETLPKIVVRKFPDVKVVLVAPSGFVAPIGVTIPVPGEGATQLLASVARLLASP